MFELYLEVCVHAIKEKGDFLAGKKAWLGQIDWLIEPCDYESCWVPGISVTESLAGMLRDLHSPCGIKSSSQKHLLVLYFQWHSHVL